MKNVAWSEAAAKMAVLPGKIDMITGIVLTGIVTNPLVAIHVRSCRVTGFLGTMHRRRSGPIVLRRTGSYRSRTVCRRLTGSETAVVIGAFLFAAFFFLGESRKE